MITLLTVGTTKSNVVLTAIKSGDIFWQKNQIPKKKKTPLLKKKKKKKKK